MNDGGPAFPGTYPHDQYDFTYGEPSWVGAKGMSLRDWFAGMVLTGVMNSGSDFISIAAENNIEAGDVPAKFAYAIADAMLKEREK